MIIIEAMIVSFLLLTKRVGLLNLLHCLNALEGLKQNRHASKVLACVIGDIVAIVIGISFRHFDFAVDNVSF